MSLLTLEQVLCESEKLTVRLTEDGNTSEDLLCQTGCVQKEIDAMKQYSEDTTGLNELARQRPHSVLVAGIQQESRRLRELQQENRELRAALEDHQNALEVIMSKYRQHVTHLVQMAHLQQVPQVRLDQQYNQLKRQSDKMSEMAAVMRMAAQTDEKDSLQDIEVISKLATENQGLREILNISVKYGSNKQTDDSKTGDKTEAKTAIAAAAASTTATTEVKINQESAVESSRVKVEPKAGSESTQSSQESSRVKVEPKAGSESTQSSQESSRVKVEPKAGSELTQSSQESTTGVQPSPTKPVESIKQSVKEESFWS
ncbi:FGFR1 oncogene partner 2 homolog [Nilaparvata lugens]|uniref:FGFR1 oncogene partner 2 homolog n=1 Tax=Nilaparvata lugens TaxID=108931 RepID=UPI00193DB58F|nr:FGFR1 oncogene partner 2 homolog [Nilaparvata lugens]